MTPLIIISSIVIYALIGIFVDGIAEETTGYKEDISIIFLWPVWSLGMICYVTFRFIHNLGKKIGKGYK